MHEVGLVQEIMRLVESSAQKERIARVEEIRLVLGRLHSALPHALKFAFRACRDANPLFCSARLEIEERELVMSCGECGEEFCGEEMAFVCPACDARGVELLSGDELYIDSYRGEEGEVCPE